MKRMIGIQPLLSPIHEVNIFVLLQTSHDVLPASLQLKRLWNLLKRD